jgi:hypothetical protein
VPSDHKSSGKSFNQITRGKWVIIMWEYPNPILMKQKLVNRKVCEGKEVTKVLRKIDKLEDTKYYSAGRGSAPRSIVRSEK